VPSDPDIVINPAALFTGLEPLPKDEFERRRR
jgi:hypothetical protein